MQSDDLNYSKSSFLFGWFLANMLGLAFGWVAGEGLGIRAANIWGWGVGQAIGFTIFEGSVWLFRSLVLSRTRTSEVLKGFDLFFWVAMELIFGFGMALANNQTVYQQESLFGIVSMPILTNWMGVLGWLILWLIKSQVRKPKPQIPRSSSILASLGRISASIFIFFFLIAVMVISMMTGEYVAKISSWDIGRAVAGALMGGLLSLLTGSAILKLLPTSTWKE